MHYSKPKLQLIFNLYRSHARPMDDFLMADDGNTNDTKYVTSKR